MTATKGVDESEISRFGMIDCGPGTEHDDSLIEDPILAAFHEQWTRHESQVPVLRMVKADMLHSKEEGLIHLTLQIPSRAPEIEAR